MRRTLGMSGLGLILLAGCATLHLQDAPESLRTWNFDTDYHITFMACLQSLTNAAYTILHQDEESGQIRSDYKLDVSAENKFRYRVDFAVSMIDPQNTQVVCTVYEEKANSYGGWAAYKTTEPKAKKDYRLFRDRIKQEIVKIKNS